MPEATGVDGKEQEDASTAIVLWAESALAARAPSPAVVAWSGERAAFRTVEFLTAGIGNEHTRRAYSRAARRFLAWCNARGLTLANVKSPDVAGYIQELGNTLAPLSVKQHLAALKHWFDWLVTGHVLEANPAHAVRGPRYSQNTGKTPVLEKEEARALLDSIDDELKRIREADEKTADEALPTSLAQAAERSREQERRNHEGSSRCATGRSSPRSSSPGQGSARLSP